MDNVLRLRATGCMEAQRFTFSQGGEMALLTGTASFVRYTVEGEVPDGFWDFAAERIAARAFRDIDDTYDEVSVGWVSVAGMFDSAFTEASFIAGDNIAMAMRVDERKVAPAVLKKFYLKEERRILKERQLPRLSRSQRQELKENVRLRLVKQAAAVPAVYEMYWSLADNIVTFFSTSGKAQTVFEELFRDTFDLGLSLQIPYTLAAGLVPEAAGELEALTPTVI
jgi:hypothetical protein